MHFEMRRLRETQIIEPLEYIPFFQKRQNFFPHVLQFWDVF